MNRGRFPGSMFGGEMPQLLGADRMPPPPTHAAGTNVVNGQKVTFDIGPTGTLVREFKTLMRGSDPSVALWQVTVSPMFRVPVGPDVLGMPPVNNGVPLMRMTWGGGGVTFRDSFFMPAAGASFCVAGSEVNIEVMPADPVTVYTPDTVPAVVGWLKPVSSAESGSELFATSTYPSPGAPEIVRAFARYLWVGGDDPAATFTVTWGMSFGTYVVALPPGMHRIPVPESAANVTIAASAGGIFRSWECRHS